MYRHEYRLHQGIDRGFLYTQRLMMMKWTSPCHLWATHVLYILFKTQADVIDRPYYICIHVDLIQVNNVVQLPLRTVFRGKLIYAVLFTWEKTIREKVRCLTSSMLDT